MSIRPVDFQAMVPKVTEQARLQNEEQHRNVSQQQQQADNTARNAQTLTDTVHQQDGAQKAEIRDKESEKRRKRREGKGAKGSAAEDASTSGAKKTIRQPTEGRTIDIRL